MSNYKKNQPVIEFMFKFLTNFSASDISHNILALLLDFVYTGKLLLNSESVWQTLSVAKELELRDAPQLCRKYIDTCLSIDTVPDQEKVS